MFESLVVGLLAAGVVFLITSIGFWFFGLFTAWRKRRLDTVNDGGDLLEKMDARELMSVLKDGETIHLPNKTILREEGKLYEVRLSSPRFQDETGKKTYKKDITPTVENPLAEGLPVNWTHVTKEHAEKAVAEALEKDLTSNVVTNSIVNGPRPNAKPSDGISESPAALVINEIPGFEEWLTPEARKVYNTPVKSSLLEVDEPDGLDMRRVVYPVVYLTTVVKADDVEVTRGVLLTRVATAAEKMAQVINWGVQYGLLGHGTLARASWISLVGKDSPLVRYVGVFCFMCLGPEGGRRHALDYEAARERYIKENGITKEALEAYDNWLFQDRFSPYEVAPPDPLAGFKYLRIDEWLNQQVGANWFCREAELKQDADTLTVPSAPPSWYEAK